eukprot:scaffold3179_cov59-Phaeocystis_antarctica.AAC.7
MMSEAKSATCTKLTGTTCARKGSMPTARLRHAFCTGAIFGAGSAMASVGRRTPSLITSSDARRVKLRFWPSGAAWVTRSQRSPWHIGPCPIHASQQYKPSPFHSAGLECALRLQSLLLHRIPGSSKSSTDWCALRRAWRFCSRSMTGWWPSRSASVNTVKPDLFSQVSSAPSLISSFTASRCPKDAAQPIGWPSNQSVFFWFGSAPASIRRAIVARSPCAAAQANGHRFRSPLKQSFS